jgi:hypothetical protein
MMSGAKKGFPVLKTLQQSSTNVYKGRTQHNTFVVFLGFPFEAATVSPSGTAASASALSMGGVTAYAKMKH